LEIGIKIRVFQIAAVITIIAKEIFNCGGG